MLSQVMLGFRWRGGVCVVWLRVQGLSLVFCVSIRTYGVSPREPEPKLVGFFCLATDLPFDATQKREGGEVGGERGERGRGRRREGEKRKLRMYAIYCDWFFRENNNLPKTGGLIVAVPHIGGFVHKQKWPSIKLQGSFASKPLPCDFQNKFE